MKKQWMKSHGAAVRRIFTSVLAVCLLVTCIPLYASARSDTDYITVGLKYGSAAVSECTLKSSDGFQIVNITGSGPEDTLPLPAYTQIVATVENGSIVIKDIDGTLLVSDMGSTGGIMPLNYEDGDSTISYGGSTYRDGIRLTVNGGKTMNVINYITVDHYLYGVIHAEMSQSYPLEALKAQAVVARSYVKMNKRAHADYGFDACATTHCQMYKGFSNEFPKTTQAVDETSGDVIYSNGKIVQAYYYKNSGGHTQNSEDVWSATEPYLRGVKDIYSPDYPWTATMTFDEIKSRLEANNYKPGTIQSVAITGRNSAGAVSQLTIKGSGNTVVLKKESVRTVLGGTLIKSTMFDMVNGISDGSGTGTSGLHASNGSSTKKIESDLYVVASSGSNKKVASGDVYISNGSKTVKGDSIGSGSSSGSTSGETLSIATDGKVIFSGKGYGHGIGMPQDSAIKMAEQGFTYDEILEFYFTGVEIRR